MFFRRGGNSSSDDSGLVDLAKVKADERARQKREHRQQWAAQRLEILGRPVALFGSGSFDLLGRDLGRA